ncbi:MAG: FAD-dependent oxidoreductase [Deinococcales bacterium]
MIEMQGQVKQDIAQNIAQSFPGRGHVYDVIIVGAGITGSEAAWALARAHLDILLITTSLDTVYNLVGEGAVLPAPEGSLMETIVAKSGDERGFVSNWEAHRGGKFGLEHQPHLHLLQSNVTSLLLDPQTPQQLKGVNTWEGVSRLSPKVALCVGSFLEARLFIGNLSEQAGRLSEMAYDELYLDLVKQGFVFEPFSLEAPAALGQLPYQVHAKAFAPREWQAENFRLTRLEGLYAAGVCVRGYLPFAEAALEGQRLAQSLLLSN